MQNSRSPLDKIRIASPCAADWTEMLGDARRRFCAECKLNVYNLSAMAREEAENLLMESEGNICVRFYRRADGTILTQNCPVGWAKIKQRVSKIATVAFSLIAGFFVGVLNFNLLENINKEAFKKAFVEAVKDEPKISEEQFSEEFTPVAGEPEFVVVEGKPIIDGSLFTPGQNKSGLMKNVKRRKNTGWANGRAENSRVVKIDVKSENVR